MPVAAAPESVRAASARRRAVTVCRSGLPTPGGAKRLPRVASCVGFEARRVVGLLHRPRLSGPCHLMRGHGRLHHVCNRGAMGQAHCRPTIHRALGRRRDDQRMITSSSHLASRSLCMIALDSAAVRDDSSSGRRSTTLERIHILRCQR